MRRTSVRPLRGPLHRSLAVTTTATLAVTLPRSWWSRPGTCVSERVRVRHRPRTRTTKRPMRHRLGLGIELGSSAAMHTAGSLAHRRVSGWDDAVLGSDGRILARGDWRLDGRWMRRSHLDSHSMDDGGGTGTRARTRTPWRRHRHSHSMHHGDSSGGDGGDGDDAGTTTTNDSARVPAAGLSTFCSLHSPLPILLFPFSCFLSPLSSLLSPRRRAQPTPPARTGRQARSDQCRPTTDEAWVDVEVRLCVLDGRRSETDKGRIVLRT